MQFKYRRNSNNLEIHSQMNVRIWFVTLNTSAALLPSELVQESGASNDTLKAEILFSQSNLIYHQNSKWRPRPSVKRFPDSYFPN